MLAVYVSGHGFGHATRTAEVLRVLRRDLPGLPFTLCTAAPSFLFDGVPAPIEIRSLQADVGLRQRDALVIDEAGSLDAWRVFAATWSQRVDGEVAWLRSAGARLVLGDIPPLAFAAAGEAGIPAVALGNFSWDWIYRHLAARHPALNDAADWAAVAYRKAELLLRLPFSGDLRVFRSIEDVPLVARRPKLAREEVRRRLGLDERPAALLSFGGIGLPGLDLVALGGSARLQFLSTGDPEPGPTGRVRHLSAAAVARAGLEYPDLVGAVDVVVSKPGYGIVSDCIGAGRPLVYTDRGDFPEYPVMVAEMARYLPAVHVTNADLRSGRLTEAIQEALSLPVPAPPRWDGAEVIARRLRAWL